MLATFMISGCDSPGKDKPEEGATALEENTAEAEPGYVQLLNGETLEGWKGDTAYWRVENGNLVGEVTPDKPLKRNTFLIWQGGQPADFELKGEFRITEDGNTGVNYRSVELDSIPFALKGYQADIDGKIRYTGQNYEERGRTTLAYRGEEVLINPQEKPAGTLRDNIKNNAWLGRDITGSLGEPDSLQALIKSEDWNDFHLVVKGNRLQHYVNGVLMSDVTDNDTVNRQMKGALGVQVHVGPPMKVEYRNLRLKQL
ncbi:hypothetical protein GCM10023188_39930 [Pontibacter saemangeumensis]|uniref:3-keto-alpha-glucoside-1,2-lyase/3-keto-2-hydroxy-glucal hydratase domain-containing protein n=2 Tax=Pontibacter saemangeumensis TaxID=1084525 RepID=A0ABP8M302_9BACT